MELKAATFILFLIVLVFCFVILVLSFLMTLGIILLMLTIVKYNTCQSLSSLSRLSTAWRISKS